MQNTVAWSILAPIILQIIQSLVLTILAVTFLRNRKMLTAPIGGSEYSCVIFSAVLVLGVLLIATASTEFLFKSYWALAGRQDGFLDLLLVFSKFFAVAVTATVFHIGLSIILTDFFGNRKWRDELMLGNLPLSLMSAALSLGIAIMCYAITLPVYQWLTPISLNFRSGQLSI